MFIKNLFYVQDLHKTIFFSVYRLQDVAISSKIQTQDVVFIKRQKHVTKKRHVVYFEVTQKNDMSFSLQKDI